MSTAQVRSGRRFLTGWLDAATLTIIAAYTAGWGLILFNGGRYWDDWCLVRLSVPTALTMADMPGQPWQGYLWLVISWVPGVEYILHALTFLLFLAVAIILHRLLRKTPGVSSSMALTVSLLFALFPVNAARVAHIDFQYTVTLAAFYAAWYLVVIDLDRPRLARRAISAVLFAFALVTTASMLMFIAIVIGHVLWICRGDLANTTKRQGLLKQYGYLILLPVIAVLYRAFAQVPWGLYEGYNQFGLHSITGLLELPAAVRGSLFAPLLPALPALGLAVPIYLLMRSRKRREGEGDDIGYAKIAGAGVIALVFALVPYLAVGKIPQQVGVDAWDSRHQLLVPLGATLILYAGVMALVRSLKIDRRVGLAVLLALTAGFVVMDARFALMYQADWYKQVALMAEMRASEAFRDGNYFVIRDEAVELNALDRRYLPYELSGMMYSVFDEPTRFAWDEALGAGYAAQLTAYREYRQYHWWEWEEPVRGYTVTIRPGDTDIRHVPTLLELMWRERVDRPGFDERLEGVLEVSAEPAE
ncbi:MAG: hypothetical protein Q7W51_06605 [Coriobacteriia bacterium]|nr:hypothetical protein [Coriobacteriia bacterium]